MLTRKLPKAVRFATMCIKSSLASFLKQTRLNGLTKEEINFSGAFFNARIIIFLELFTFKKQILGNCSVSLFQRFKNVASRARCDLSLNAKASST